MRRMLIPASQLDTERRSRVPAMDRMSAHGPPSTCAAARRPGDTPRGFAWMIATRRAMILSVNAALPSLIIAALGIAATLAGTLGGVLLTQRSADRRERALWAREDELRTFEHRRIAYVDFYQANVDAQRSAAAYFSARGRGDDTVEWPPYPPLRAALALAEQRREVLAMYATPRVTTLARKAQEAYRMLVLEARRQWEPDDDHDDQFKKRMDKCDTAASELLKAIRADLGVPND